VTQELTGAAGRPAYEISNHARPGAECRHNLLYWRYGDYAGVGPGAHGRLTIEGRRVAFSTERLPERWQRNVETSGHALVEQMIIEQEDAAREHLLMNLRLAEGVDLAAYEQRWGVLPDRSRIAFLTAQGLLSCVNGTLAATPPGRLVLNRIIAEIAP
jgi:oxygen-independent coproporphyrinogen-3 oxidase